MGARWAEPPGIAPRHAARAGGPPASRATRPRRQAAQTLVDPSQLLYFLKLKRLFVIQSVVVGGLGGGSMAAVRPTYLGAVSDMYDLAAP